MYGIVYDLLHNGKIRKTLPRWQRRTVGRQLVARAFCVDRTAAEREAKEATGDKFVRSQSVALQSFLVMRRGERLNCIRQFLGNQTISTKTIFLKMLSVR